MPFLQRSAPAAALFLDDVVTTTVLLFCLARINPVEDYNWNDVLDNLVNGLLAKSSALPFGHRGQMGTRARTMMIKRLQPDYGAKVKSRAPIEE